MPELHHGSRSRTPARQHHRTTQHHQQARQLIAYTTKQLARFRALLMSTKHIPELDEVSAQRIGPQGVGDDPLRDLSPLPGPWGRRVRGDGTSPGHRSGLGSRSGGLCGGETVGEHRGCSVVCRRSSYCHRGHGRALIIGDTHPIADDRRAATGLLRLRHSSRAAHTH